MAFVLLDTTFASLLHSRKSHTPAAEILKRRLLRAQAARVVNYTSALGRRLDTADAWVAATAVLYELPLLTADTDFLGWTMPGLRIDFQTP